VDHFSEKHYPRLWKSEDGGVTWSDKTSKVLGAENLPEMPDDWSTSDAEDFTWFTTVSVAPDDPDFVVVGGWSYDDAGVYIDDIYPFDDPTIADADMTYYMVPVVVGSNDGAGKFYYMGCSTVSGMITAIDVSMEVDDKHSIAVGTWDWEADVLQDGPNSGIYDDPYDYDLARVWRYDAGGYWSAYWADTSNYDGWEPCDAIVDLEFSPNFDVDDTLMVLCIDDVNGADVPSHFENDDDYLDDADQNDFWGYKVQAATWNSIDAWNGEAEFDGYPVVIRNDDYEIVCGGIEWLGWDEFGSMIRHAGDIDLPVDFMGDDNSERKYMVAVNGVEWNMLADEAIDDGGFLFWVENTTISLELLDHEDNPYIASIDYHGNVDMEGRTLVGLMFPKDWRWQEIGEWLDSDLEGRLPCCTGVQVLRSETTDVCCPDWDWSCKPPSGQYMAVVMMTPDGDWAYAATRGESRLAEYQSFWGEWSDESAFSISGHEGELGESWNQSALIDTDIDFISDVAVTTNTGGDDECSPSCACIYLATINHADEIGGGAPPGLLVEGKVCGCDSIWRSCDGGDTWLRIWHKELQGDPMDPDEMCYWPVGSEYHVEWMILGLAPEEQDDPMTIYMADLGTETIWQSEASGDACCPAGLGCWTDRNTGLDADGGIADFAVLDADTLYVVAFNGDMVKSTTKGRHWSSQEDTKVDDDDEEMAHDIIAMGDWVVVGGDKGTVSYSDDGGDSFSVLDDIGAGEVHLAFDSYFDDNGYVYAAVACGDNGIYRTTIDDADFEDMEACDGLCFWGIVVSDGGGNPETSASTGGVLYATYTGAEGGDCGYSGVARILNPASSSCCGSHFWDYLFDNLWSGAQFANQPTNIAICGDASGGASTVWAIETRGVEYDSYYEGWNACYTEFTDSNRGRLWKFNDVFGKGGPELIGVADGATIPSDPCDCVNEDFVLEWDRICDACEYDIEIALDEGFKHKVWTTGTICDTWPSVGCIAHEFCIEGVLDNGCNDTGTFYKPSDPCVPSIVVPQGTLDCGQEYWWRVRARFAETGEAYRSWWSDKWSFTVAVGPGGAIQLTAPDDGASNVPLENIVFTWTAVADATSYELIVSDASGAEVASNSGDATSFVLGSKLDYDSSYMWQVNAMKGSNVISESGTSTFRTMSPHPPPPPEYPETVINFPEPVTGTPTWVWVVIALAAVLIIVIIVLIFRTRRV
jgi:hypothetical protein